MSKELIEVLEMKPIPCVAIKEAEAEFIDANPSYFTFPKGSIIDVIRRLLGVATVLAPPTSTAAIAAGSASLSFPATVDNDLVGFLFGFNRNFNVSSDIVTVSIASFDRRGTAFLQTFSFRPKAEEIKIPVLFASASQDVVGNLIVAQGEIETLTTVPAFQAVSATITVTSNSNGANVSAVGFNLKHSAVVELLQQLG